MISKSYEIFPIGVVRNTEETTRIEIYSDYEAALLGLDGFSHVTVLYWFHQNDTLELRTTLQVHPRKNRDNPLTGVFATHSPVRPNLIAMTPCKILDVDGRIIFIDEIDARDGSPVIDIKPYIAMDSPAAESIKTPAWVSPHRQAPTRDMEPDEIHRQPQKTAPGENPRQIRKAEKRRFLKNLVGHEP